MASEDAALLRRVFSTGPNAQISHVEVAAHDILRPQRPLIHNVGRGTCGTVYGIGPTNRVIKLGASARDLLSDYRQTSKAGQAVEDFAESLVIHFATMGICISVPKVPRCYHFHKDCADVIARYEEQLSSDDGFFPGSEVCHIDEGERRKPGFVMERIPPIPHCAREALVKELFDEEDHGNFINDEESADCLLRLYFGTAEDGSPVSDLRNFPFYTDQMDEIGLDTKTLVTELAVGLAIVHWAAELDGMDVEYVLSSSPPHRLPSHGSEVSMAIGDGVEPAPNVTRRDTHIWILDFDKASPLKLDDEAELIRQLVVATSGNDPYFPRPDLNEARWVQFREAYISASEVLLRVRVADGGLDRGLLEAPKRFMDALQRHFVDNKADEDDFIFFED